METLKCSVCGGELKESDSFCRSCGSPVAAQSDEMIKEAAETVETVTEEAVETVEPVAEESAAPAEEATEAAEPTEPAAETPVASAEVEPVEPVAETPVAPVTEVVETTTQAQTFTEEKDPVEQGTTILKGDPYTSGQQSFSNYNEQAPYSQVYTETPEKESKIFGLIGMICGIVSILCCIAGPLFAIPGAILSVVGMIKKEKKVLPIVGIITSALGFIIGIIVICCIVYASVNA